MHRLFVALRPPASVRALLLAAGGGVRGARWQDDDQLHLTLRFVGEVDGARAEDVAAALGAVRHPPVAVRLAGLGTFDRRGRTDTLWIGAGTNDALHQLHRKVDAALVRAGLPPDGRAYLPHVTLARMGRDAGPAEPFLSAAAGLATPEWTADAFMLFESRLGHGGASYEAVTRYGLVA